MKTRILHFAALIILDAFLIFLYILNNHILTLMLLLLAVLLPPVSFLILRRQRRSISLTLSALHPSGDRNKPNSIRLNFRNESLFPCSVATVSLGISSRFRENDYSHEYRCYVSGRGNTTHDIPLSFSYCGCYVATVNSLKLTDFFGICSVDLVLPPKLEILVMPELIHFTDDADSLKGETEKEELYSKDEKGDDYSEIRNIREYQAGDKLQTVHWKLSAKEQTLMVKEFGSLSGDLYQIYLEEDFKELRQSDAYYDLLYSLLSLLTRQNINYSVIFPNARGTDFERLEIKTASDIDDLIIRSYYGEHTASDSLFTDYPKESGSDNVLLITTRVHNGHYIPVYNHKNMARIYRLKRER